MTTPPTSTIGETGQQKFERLLSQDRFKGLKAILDRLT